MRHLSVRALPNMVLCSALPLLATLLTSSLLAATPSLSVDTTAALPERSAAIEFPLSTHEQWIVDAKNERVKLKGVNWYGASDGYNVVGGLDKNSLPNIVRLIRDLGFNSVRLPFSNHMLRAAPVAPSAVAANPQFAGKQPLEVYDAVIKELTDQGLMVILNNHTTDSVWCCGNDNNALWFNHDFTSEQWMQDWEMVIRRYMNNPRVIAADLRNEVRWGPLGQAQWGTGDELWDWRLAAEILGDKLLAINSGLLIIVEGLNYATDFSHITAAPVRLALPNKLVYSSHSYSWFRGGDESKVTYSEVKQGLDRGWGFLNAGTAGYRVPIWIGEFGTGPNDDHTWFTYFVRYLQENDLDWCIWPLNVGPTAGGNDEQWGLLSSDWQHPLNDWRTSLLRTIE